MYEGYARDMKAYTLALIGVGMMVFVGCEQKAPPPMPTKSSAGDPAQVARQVRGKVNETVGSIGDSQDKASAMADEITGGKKNAGGAAGHGGHDGSFAVSGVQFAVPEGWTPLPLSSSMRAADLQFKTAEGEANAVFFAIGGDAASNIERWKGQVELKPGTSSTTTSEEVAGLKLTRVTMVGTYSGMTAMGTPAPAVANTKFIGIVIEGGKGPIQIKFTGPESVVKAAESSFNAMIAGMKRMP